MTPHILPIPTLRPLTLQHPAPEKLAPREIINPGITTTTAKMATISLANRGATNPGKVVTSPVRGDINLASKVATSPARGDINRANREKADTNPGIKADISLANRGATNPDNKVVTNPVRAGISRANREDINPVRGDISLANREKADINLAKTEDINNGNKGGIARKATTAKAAINNEATSKGVPA